MLFCIDKQADESFLQSLFSRLNDDEDEEGDDGKERDDNDDDDDDDDDDAKLRRRRDVVQFLKEFCLFSQTLAPQNRDSFFKVSVFLSDQLQVWGLVIRPLNFLSLSFSLLLSGNNSRQVVYTHVPLSLSSIN